MHNNLLLIEQRNSQNHHLLLVYYSFFTSLCDYEFNDICNITVYNILKSSTYSQIILKILPRKWEARINCTFSIDMQLHNASVILHWRRNNNKRNTERSILVRNNKFLPCSFCCHFPEGKCSRPGWMGLWLPGLVESFLVCGKEVGIRWSLRCLPAQTILCFYCSVIYDLCSVSLGRNSYL